MDDAPYTGDLDLAAVATRSELAGLLRTVHLRADRPSLRSLEARTRHSASPLSKTAVAEMLKAARFPRRTVMVAFLRTCGVPDSTLEPWLRAWERVAARESRTPGRNQPCRPWPAAADSGAWTGARVRCFWVISQRRKPGYPVWSAIRQSCRC